MERRLRRLLVDRVQHYRAMRGLWDHNLFRHKVGTPREQFQARNAMDNLVPVMTDALADVAQTLNDIETMDIVARQVVEE